MFFQPFSIIELKLNQSSNIIHFVSLILSKTKVKFAFVICRLNVLIKTDNFVYLPIIGIIMHLSCEY
jgi:hypothetical protein